MKQIVPPDGMEQERVSRNWLRKAEILRKMNECNNEHIVRFITAFTRPDFRSVDSHYLVCEWADRGSLQDLLAQSPSPTLGAKLVKQTVTQLLGLATALHRIHDLGFRHGSIKPDNVLRFRPCKDSIIGTLKLGVWGLAGKDYSKPTDSRLQSRQSADTRYRNDALYDPPEVELGVPELLSRLSDIWSMGCVILEMLIWLAYGYESVDRFRRDVRGPYKAALPCYVVGEHEDGKMRAGLRSIVEDWLNYMAEEPIFGEDTALGDLLSLVREDLLIVEVPQGRGRTVYIRGDLDPLETGGDIKLRGDLGPKWPTRHRATTSHLVAALEDVGIPDDEERPDDYWLKEGIERRPAPEFYDAVPKAIKDGLEPQLNQGGFVPDVHQLSIQPYLIVCTV